MRAKPCTLPSKAVLAILFAALNAAVGGCGTYPSSDRNMLSHTSLNEKAKPEIPSGTNVSIQCGSKSVRAVLEGVSLQERFDWDPQQEELVGAYVPGSFRAERLNLDNGVTAMVIDPAVTPDNRLTFGLSNKELVKCFGTERLEFRPTGLGTGVIIPANQPITPQ
ncbi:MAG: hypothetical protein ACRD9S_26015 [Pyrinomonadaceae bacterium]